MIPSRADFEAMLRGESEMPTWLRAPLSLGAHLNEAGMARRLRAEPIRVNAHVVSFGNLTLGGTGKTPAVIARAQMELAAGRYPCVVTRGYHAARTNEPLLLPPYGNLRVPSLTASQIAERFGDEAALIAWRAPGCAIAKGRDRVAAAQAAITQLGCNVILLDDGFQYIRLERDENILLVDATCPFGNRAVFPAGYLREPPIAAARATEILITHADLVEAQTVDALTKELRALRSFVPIRCTIHAPVTLTRLSDGAEISLEFLDGRTVRPYCGVGNPVAFHKTLERLGATLADPVILTDHGAGEKLLSIEGTPFVMTEKDAVKLTRIPKDAYALGIQLRAFPTKKEAPAATTDPDFDFGGGNSMDEFVLRSEGGPKLRLFEPVGTKEVDSCIAELSFDGLQAQTNLYCYQIEFVLEFFDKMAARPEGWHEIYTADSLESEIMFRATFHRTGRIGLDIRFRPFDARWEVHTEMSIPSGEMPEIAYNLRHFMRRPLTKNE